MTEQMKMDGGKNGGPVECLGMTFPSDDARREHFSKLLAEKLKDPAFRAQEGFPTGSDEAIITLSDPPYYTACPNPWFNDFISSGKSTSAENSLNRRKPFTADVSEGKNDKIYFAHSYHTKVPHKAIMRYILHYTNPGDTVFDGFCGTGMTGVAAQLCGNKSTLISLGYRVDDDGTIYQKDELSPDNDWKPFSRIGTRTAILMDLSPAATFIAQNYNSEVNPETFLTASNRALQLIIAQRGWMFRTLHSPSEGEMSEALSLISSSNSDSKMKLNQVMRGEVNYVAWSDVFSCPECAGEIIFWDSAVDTTTGSVLAEFPCPHCSASLGKRKLQRLWESVHDTELNTVVRQAKQMPAYISYKIGTKRFAKKPDAADLALVEQIKKVTLPKGCPTHLLHDGYNTRQPIESHGYTHSHHFYTRRNIIVLGDWKESAQKLSEVPNLTSTALVASKLYRFRSQGGSLGAGGGPMNGAIYVPSLIKEIPTTKLLKEHIKKTAALKAAVGIAGGSIIGTGTSTKIETIADNSVDYIFLDPPFGGNIMYSDLNFLWEDWIGVFTNQDAEAIKNPVQNKSVEVYRQLMAAAFKEAFRILKKGRWITVEFSNTQSSIWTAIQAAIQEAGFIIANVSALDKKQGSFKAVTTTTAVKQDLIISAYKPDGGLEEQLNKEQGSEKCVWDFVRSHIEYLPVTRESAGELEYIVERDPRIIFDRLVAWYVRHNFLVPLSSQEFQEGLRKRFSEREGMIFSSEQASVYDRSRSKHVRPPQIELFVSDERSAIDWLIEFLKKRPSTYQEVHPEFTTQLGAGWRKHEERPELSALLDENFLRFDGNGEVPSQIHSYLSTNFKDLRGLEKEDPRLKAKAKDRWFVPDPNKAKDLEQKRERSLLKEFEAYKTATKRQLKESRLEVLRAGFKTAWAGKDYKTIIGIAEKLPDQTLQEDEKLLLWYDQALTRMEADA